MIEKDFETCWENLVSKRDKLQADIDLRNALIFGFCVDYTLLRGIFHVIIHCKVVAKKYQTYIIHILFINTYYIGPNIICHLYCFMEQTI